MNYPYKTVTDDGVNLLSSTIGQNDNNILIDKVIIADKPVLAANSLHKLSMNDFRNPITHNIDVVLHTSTLTLPEVTINNVGLKHDYPIYMIGLLAHTTLSGTEVVYAAAMSDNEPFTMPKQTGDELDLSLTLPISFSNDKNVKIIAPKTQYITNNSTDTTGLKQYEAKTNQEIQELKDKLNSIHLKGLTFDQIKK